MSLQPRSESQKKENWNWEDIYLYILKVAPVLKWYSYKKVGSIFRGVINVNNECSFACDIFNFRFFNPLTTNNLIILKPLNKFAVRIN